MKPANTDSLGNPLPQLIFIWAPASSNQIDRALAINSFLLAAEMAMQNGHTVVYDANAKSAKIIREEGSIGFIMHS